MSIKNILDESEKEFDEKFPAFSASLEELLPKVKSFNKALVVKVLKGLREDAEELTTSLRIKVKSSFTSQAFISWTCPLCKQGKSWHNGAPPKICLECSKEIREEEHNKVLYMMSGKLGTHINSLIEELER